MTLRVWTWCIRRGRLLLVVACMALPGGAAAEIFPLREVGDPLPKISLNDVEGAPRILDPLNLERPLLLFFWSVYCPNCKDAMPGLAELAADASGSQVEVWGINVDGERFSNAVRAYVGEMELPFPNLYDRLEGELLVAADPLGVSKTPTLYLAGSDGRVLLRQVAKIDTAAVRAALRSLASP